MQRRISFHKQLPIYPKIPQNILAMASSAGVPTEHPHPTMKLYFLAENSLHCVMGSLLKSIPVNAAI